MSLVAAISIYLSLNILVAAAFAATHALRRFTFAAHLKFSYAMVIGVLLFTAVQPWLPALRAFEPPAKLWSAGSYRDFAPRTGTAFVSFTPLSRPAAVDTGAAHRLFFVLVFSLAFLLLVALLRNTRALRRICEHSFLLRRQGKVFIYLSSRLHTPLCFRLPGRAVIVIPYAFSIRPDRLRMAVMHELQHHRQGDTAMAYALWILQRLCFLNPLAYLWTKQISDIQELACDEALIGRGKAESQAYARCLIEVAESALANDEIPACAAGFVFGGERVLLKRRINKMFNVRPKDTRVKTGIALVALAGFLSLTAFASRDLIQDRRITMEEAETMARKARQSGSTFPIVVNQYVVNELNRFLGTPEGREIMRSSLRRMDEQSERVTKYLRKYGAPEELRAMPLVESGYRSLKPAQNTHTHAAGMWQFIPSTARVYGMRVDAQADDRLNPDLETDAAIRYMQANYARFNDWHLALLAYNSGEENVQKWIDELGVRHVWTLIRNGYEGDHGYVARMIAAVLIMRNREAVL